MKQFLLFACLLFTTAGLTAQVVYVNSAAMGANNGTSWADAYSELDSAFVNAPSGAAIWIAAGTYTTPADRSFIIEQEQTVLGGFAGTETSADEADPDKNVTILSGDVNGNDVVGVYDSLGYEDNNRVLFVNDTAAVSRYVVTLDGFTVANGGIEVDATSFANGGAGIRSYARLDASRLNFVGNRGPVGSAVMLAFASSAGSRFDDITVGGNFTGAFRTIYLDGTSDIVWSNSTFAGLGMDVGQVSGIFQFQTCNDVTVSDCTFSEIAAVAGAGSALRFSASDNVEVTNCTFSNMRSTAGAVFISGGSSSMDLTAEDHIFTNCTFTNCDVIGTGRGGALYVSSGNATFTDCDIDGSNNPGGIGGAMYFQLANTTGLTYTVNINGGSFSNCTDVGLGGAICVLGFQMAEGVLNIDGTTFTNNTSGNLVTDVATFGSGSGGAVFFQARADEVGSGLSVKNATFRGNSATNGGAISLGRSGNFVVDNTTFDGNRAIGSAGNPTLVEGSGGAFEYGGPSPVTFTNSRFTKNTAGGLGVTTTRGGALFFSATNSATKAVPYTFDNCEFSENVAVLGGSIYAQAGYALILKNSEFINNGLLTPNETTRVPATNLGGVFCGLFNATTSSITIDSSTFMSNKITMGSGGVIYSQALTAAQGNELTFHTSTIDIQNSTFDLNSTSEVSAGGAIRLSGGHFFSVDDSDFISNSTAGEGGAISTVISAVLDTTVTPRVLRYPPFEGEVSRSLFRSNSATTQGGAISTQRTNMDLTNNVFLYNNVNGGGSGGAIIYNGNAPDLDLMTSMLNPVGSLELVTDIVHNTFFGNTRGNAENSKGDQIAFFQPGETSLNEANSLTANILNNAFLDIESDDPIRVPIEVEPLTPDGTATFPDFIQPIGNLDLNFIGGNFFNAENGPTVMIGPNDRLTTTEFQSFGDLAELFTDLDDENDDILDVILNIGEDGGASNPLIDGGVQDPLVPATDFFGTERGATPDIGAIEADPFLTGVGEQIEESGLDMAFFPNPTVNVVTIQNNDANIGKFHVIVSDQAGRTISSNVFSAVNNRIDLTAAPTGIYNLQLIINGKIYSKQIVKQ